METTTTARDPECALIWLKALEKQERESQLKAEREADAQREAAWKKICSDVMTVLEQELPNLVPFASVYQSIPDCVDSCYTTCVMVQIPDHAPIFVYFTRLSLADSSLWRVCRQFQGGNRPYSVWTSSEGYSPHYETLGEALMVATNCYKRWVADKESRERAEIEEAKPTPPTPPRPTNCDYGLLAAIRGYVLQVLREERPDA